MKFKVQMLAYQDEQCSREVEVPASVIAVGTSDKQLLELIYIYGQNDMQVVEGVCSVSVGDVIELGDKLYQVCMVGFKEMSRDEHDKYLAMNQDERLSASLVSSLTE